MVSGATIKKKYKRFSAINIVITLAASIVAAIFAGNIASNIIEKHLRANIHETLAVETEALTGMLDKYRLLPTLLGKRPDVPPLFTQAQTARTKFKAQRIARETAGLSGAMDIMLIHPNGQLLAAGINILSDTIAPDSPLITNALQGRLGREVRLLENGKQAYVFTSGVHGENGIVGIIAVYVSLEELEATWSLTANPILAVSENKTVVISNRAEWRRKSISDIKTTSNDKIFFKTGNGKTQHLVAVRPLPLLGWTLCVLANTSPMRMASIFWAIFAVLSCIAIAVIAQTIINKWHANIRRTRRERATSLRLERTIRDRTRALSQSNKTLEREIGEHKRSDEQLRKTQNELVQTGKLAALGQMSTALSHEFNQPLAAAKSYADNALTYLDRGQTEDVRSNIKRISELTDRMAEIAKHLRNFARKPNPTYGTVPIHTVIEDALSVLSSRIHADNAEITITNAENNTWVRAGYVRLQQVIINLVLNALDAMSDQPIPRIIISTNCINGKVLVKVTDHGPGIEPTAIDYIFDPFFTTKKIGHGLGLGLSISYNIIKDFDGQLSAKNNVAGGAEFTITLEEGTQTREAAE